MANAPTSATPASRPSRGPARRVLIIGACLLVALLVVVIFVAVRSGNGEMRDLAARVATHENAERGIIVFDVDAAREAAGLPADADPADPWAEDADPTGDEALAGQRFRTAGMTIPHLQHPLEDGPAASIDTGQVSAAATVMGGRLAVIRTSQDFEEIATAFEEAGYDRDGDVVTYTGDDGSLGGEHVYANLGWRDGLLVVSTDPDGDPDAVRAALADDVDDSDLASFATDLMGDTGAPGVLVAEVPDAESVSCVSRVGVADLITGSGEYVLVSDDPGDVDVVLGDEGHRGRYQYDEPEVDGEQVRVGIEVNEATFSPLLTWAETSMEDVWTCAG